MSVNSSTNALDAILWSRFISFQKLSLLSCKKSSAEKNMTFVCWNIFYEFLFIMNPWVCIKCTGHLREENYVGASDSVAVGKFALNGAGACWQTFVGCLVIGLTKKRK